MNQEKEVDSSDMAPETPEGPKPAASEKAQKDAAEEREAEGGYQ